MSSSKSVPELIKEGTCHEVVMYSDWLDNKTLILVSEEILLSKDEFGREISALHSYEWQETYAWSCERIKSYDGKKIF